MCLGQLLAHNNWTTINNEWYYFKKYNDINYYIINELIGEELATRCSIPTINYQIAYLQEDSSYILLSKDFRDPNFEYVQISNYDIPLIEFTNDRQVIESIESFKRLKSLCQNNNNYKSLITDILNMMILDFYMGQLDRSYNNFLLKKAYSFFNLAELFDYEFSFEEHPSVYFNKSINSIAVICFPGKILEQLFQDYPDCYNTFKLLYNTNMEELLNFIEEKHHFDIHKGVKDYYTDYYDRKRKIARKCL